MERLKIIIADDDEDDREMFCDALKMLKEEAECIHANDGIEALKQAHQHNPDYIFLDLNMPRCDGFHCLEQLKLSETLRSIPVIIYSTSRRREDKERTKRLGASYFISKPDTIAELCNQIRFILSERWNEA